MEAPGAGSAPDGDAVLFLDPQQRPPGWAYLHKAITVMAIGCLTAAVGGCDGGVHLCGLSLRFHGADAGAGGPSVDPRPEREAEKETAVRVGMTFRK